ncbi:hypothetical protein [Photorhabdus heterorhabditis]|uniref:Uncharacterized protein n=1 Tax=Photorhabdus heterorhabditis TaxID=880156 RepID=A0A5B0VS67_9GAMM|nr:hypothetical protein [Photorhabdus heterorhabditis]KAA1177324.1 hypothetical protein F0L16_19450 [Photorhabdus heterorhabditis]KOY62071.1 hypothetical protein AM629_10620 [Photorhabdus heterorhabditis]
MTGVNERSQQISSLKDEGYRIMNASDFYHDKEVQKALGIIITNPYRLMDIIKGGSFEAINDFPDKNIKKEVEDIINKNHKNMLIISNILDERLLNNVKRYIPLLNMKLKNSLLNEFWIHYRKQKKEYRNNTAQYAFDLLLSMPHETELWSLLNIDCKNIFEYEKNILHVSLGLIDNELNSICKGEKNNQYNLLYLSQPIIINLPPHIIRKIHDLRNNKTEEIKHNSYDDEHCSEVKILIYKSWKNKKVHTLRIDNKTSIFIENSSKYFFNLPFINDIMKELEFHKEHNNTIHLINKLKIYGVINNDFK